ncbi:MAG: thiamine pyrophosphate-dependent enzyme [bacterium]|nr:thiamine pyrophosphate-dependent enzyme [bacterium]
MNTTEYLLKCLESLGVTDIFGISEEYNINILNEINSNPKLNWIECTNELNAGYATDGYARIKGFGALVTTYGTGELSVLSAIAGSYSENVPVVHIVGVPPLKLIEKKNIRQSIQPATPYCYFEMFKNITCASTFLNKENAKIEIDRVLKALVKERKPIYIAIPADIVNMNISDKETDFEWFSNTQTLNNVVDKIITKISKSESPLIVADNLINRFDAKIEFKEFTEKSGIPVTNLFSGPDLVNPDYKNYLGTYLGSYSNNYAEKYLRKSDCLISVGVNWSLANTFGAKPPCEINSDIAIYGTCTFIDGKKYNDIKMQDVLEGLTEKLEHHDYKIEKQETENNTETNTEKNLNFKYISNCLGSYFKSNDIVFAETGLSTYCLAEISIPENLNLQMQLQWGATGWATPAAFGACIACPNSNVILITGERSHQMSVLEIGNMIKHEAKPAVVVLNNSGDTLKRFLPEDCKANHNDIVQIDYSKLVRAFNGDVWSLKVKMADDFNKALRATGLMDKLCYIEVMLEKDDIPTFAKKVFAKEKPAEKQVVKEKIKEIPQKNSAAINNTSIHSSENTDYQTHTHPGLKELE